MHGYNSTTESYLLLSPAKTVVMNIDPRFINRCSRHNIFHTEQEKPRKK